MLCIQRESSAPTLPILHPFYVGNEDNHMIIDDVHNSTNFPINQKKHISISSEEEPVKFIQLDDYCKQKPLLHSQPIITEFHLQSLYDKERTFSPNIIPYHQSFLTNNLDCQINQSSRIEDIPVENFTLHNEKIENIPCCNITDKAEPYEINEDFLREPIPNGGWGWLVALGSFLCIFTVDGVCFSYGLHINEMIREGQFNIDSSDVNNSQQTASLAMLSLPGALLCGIYFLFGPLTGALVNRFDYRIVASIGSVITSLCLLICALFIYDLIIFTIVFGVIGGIGCSLIYLPAITVVGHWFEDHRAFIVGMVMCGGCLGSGLMSIITPYLAHHFSWRGSLILIAGLFNQTLVGIALFRPISVHEKIKAVKLLKQSEKKDTRMKHHKSKKHKLTFLSLCSRNKSSKHRQERKVAIQRGSIMARIIEEKSRQRTTSTGSLDGMVITRENQLVALSSSNAYEVVMAAAAVYNANNMINIQKEEKEKEQYKNEFQLKEEKNVEKSKEQQSIIHSITEDNNRISLLNSTSMEHIKYSNSIEVIDNSLKCTLDNNNRINLQTLTEEFQTSSFCQTSQICHKNSQPLCVAVLPPPVQFTRAAVRRIARAILRKLHGQNKLPFSPSITSISTSSRQVITTMNRNNDDNHIESCTNFNSTPYTDNSKNIQYDKMNQVYRYELFHGSMATSIYRRKRSLIASSLYSELASSVKDTETSNEQQHHLSVGVNCSISSQESHSRLKPPTSDSPSALTSLISLDSYTGHLIARELNSLLLDKDTKLAIMNDIQRELSRPKYRPDFFYAGNKHKLPLCHVPEYTTFKQFPCDVNYTTKELKFNQTHLFNSNSKKSPTNVLQKGLSIEGVIGLSMNKSVTLLDPQKTALINAYHHHYHHQQQKKGISDIKNLMNSPKTNELFAYLTDMLDSRILQSFTFIILSIACFINMFVLLVPFHYLPLLLDYGGLECHFNSLWCPNGLMDIDNNNNIDNNKKVNRTHDQDVLMTSYNNELSVSAVNFVGKNYAFASSELLLLTIGCASLLGRLFAGLYIEKGLNTNRKFLRQCPQLVDPMLLNNISLILCGLSVMSFPLAIHGVIQTSSLDRLTHRVLQVWSLQFRRQLLYFAGTVYGLATAMSISLRSVILVELFGLRRLTNAFGYLLVFQGLGVICGPPLFGLFSDQACHQCFETPSQCDAMVTQMPSTNQKDCTMRLILSFYICAGFFILSSLLFMPLRWLARRDPYRHAYGYEIQSSVIVLNDDTLHPVDEELFSFTSVGSRHCNEVYDPQETQTTHILCDQNESNVKII